MKHLPHGIIGERGDAVSPIVASLPHKIFRFSGMMVLPNYVPACCYSSSDDTIFSITASQLFNVIKYYPVVIHGGWSEGLTKEFLIANATWIHGSPYASVNARPISALE